MYGGKILSQRSYLSDNVDYSVLQINYLNLIIIDIFSVCRLDLPRQAKVRTFLWSVSVNKGSQRKIENRYSAASLIASRTSLFPASSC